MMRSDQEHRSSKGLQSKSLQSKTMGAGLMVAGCCIGAGMLGMPVVSGPYGFLPALLMFFFGFIYMVTAGIVLGNLIVEEKKRGVEHLHLLSLSREILGRRGKAITWILFGFLFYSVLTAYTIGSAHLIRDIIERLFPTCHFSFRIYAVFSTIAVGYVILRGAKAVDYVNRWCLLGLISVYLAILVMASTEIELSRLERSFWTFSLFTTLPVIVFSFGYHNLIPTMASYLNFEMKALRRSIFFGSGIALIVYLLWEAIIFGVIPLNSAAEWTRFIQSGDMITRVLNESIGVSRFTDMMELFALFAIITSYITVGISMSDFLQDGLRRENFSLNKEEKWHEADSSKFVYVLLALLPPLGIGISYPHIFLTALNYSGGVIAILLFGILPALCRIARPIRSEKNTILARLKEKLVISFLIIGGIFIMVLEMGHRLVQG